MVTLATMAACGVLALNLIEPAQSDWRWWFIGAMNGIVAILALRFGGRVAFAAALGIIDATGFALLVAGRDFSVIDLANTCTQSLLCAVVGTLVRLGLDRASATANEASRSSYQLLVDDLAQTSVDSAWRARLGSSAAPTIALLRRIGAGTQLTQEDRRSALRLESAIRDRLVARAMWTEDLAAEIELARRRGVHVEVAVDARMAVADATRFRQLVMTFLPLVRGDTMFRATWQAPLLTPAPREEREPSGREQPLGRILVIPPDPVAVEKLRGSALPPGPVRIDLDEEMVLVELGPEQVPALV